MSQAKFATTFADVTSANSHEQTMADQVEKKEREIAVAERTLAELCHKREQSTGVRTADQDVAAAMELFSQIEQIAQHVASRERVGEVLQKLCFMMGVRFRENPHSRRPKHIPIGGIITIGDPNSPIARNHQHDDGPPDADNERDRCGAGPFGMDSPAVGIGRRRLEASIRKGAVGTPRAAD